MPRGGRSWTAEEEQSLMALIDQNQHRQAIAQKLGRTVAAIEGRLNVLRNRQGSTNARVQTDTDRG
jgi:hypothetical protein